MGTAQSDVMWRLVREHREELISFAQKLVQTPSPSGQEEGVAQLVAVEMKGLGYDEVQIDAAGNVIGRVEGGDGPSAMLNGHMDHVDTGDTASWSYPPFGGQIVDGQLWGRAAVDMKGALAAMVYAGGLLRKMSGRPPGDRYVVGVVQEELGGVGSRHLAQTLAVDRVVIGEASENQLRRGHRGRVELLVHFQGRSAHASMPDLAVNPHFSMARFVRGLEDLHMAQDPHYGASTVAPTRVVSEPGSANVTPSDVRLCLDWRNIPGETPKEIVVKLESLLSRSLDPECKGTVDIADKRLLTYTGLRMAYPDVFPSFNTEVDDPWLIESQALVSDALGRRVEVGTWRFATDGGHFSAAGATVIGLGPGDPAVVHTVRERLPIEQLVESAVAYLALCS